jgi:hypothetical protein
LISKLDEEFIRFTPFDGKIPVVPSWNCFPIRWGVRPTLGGDEEDEKLKMARSVINRPVAGVSYILFQINEEEIPRIFDDYSREIRRLAKGGTMGIFRTCAANGVVTNCRRWYSNQRLFQPAQESLPVDDLVAPAWFTAMHNVDVAERFALWSLSFHRSSHHVPIRLPTDPTGVLDWLRNRDKIGSRREALLHWVHEHARKNRTNDDVHTVREYLRGKRTCVWNGMRVEIRESEKEREELVNRDGH